MALLLVSMSGLLNTINKPYIEYTLKKIQRIRICVIKRHHGASLPGFVFDFTSVIVQIKKSTSSNNIPQRSEEDL
jgi:hypothetical protein